MHKRNKKTKRVVLAAGLMALAMLAGGNAFTASNTFAADATADITGYGETTVSGGTVTSLVYNLSADGSTIDSVSLALQGDTSNSAVSIGFNDGATTSCGTGTYDGTTETTYTCDNGGGSLGQSTSALTKTAVVIN